MNKTRVSAFGVAAALGVGLFASSAAADDVDTQWIFSEDDEAGAQWIFSEDGDGGDLGPQWWY